MKWFGVIQKKNYTITSPHSLILNLRKLILHGGLAIIKIHHNFVENSAVVSFFYFNLNLPK